tara:strand:- start:1 stop:327 length:327 start_codon:yes stop_codon:yes gene_type:complete
MARLQVDIAHSMNSYFKLLPDYSLWRDCGGTIHWTAVREGKVIEASCYVDDDEYELISHWFEEDDGEDEEDIEHTDDETESEDEPDSDDEDFIVDEEDEGPVQKKRKV